MWVATTQGVSVFQNGTFEAYRPDLFAGKFVSDVFWDSKQRLWVSVNQDGLFCIQGESVKVWNKQSGFHSNRVRMVEEDPEGNLWVATQDGLIKMSPDGQKRVFRNVDGLGGNFILSVFCDSKGRIWVGSVGGGLVKIEQDQVTNVVEGTDAESAVVFATTEIKEGMLITGWVGGIIAIGPGDAVNILPFGENGEQETVFGLTEDSNGDYWARVNRAIKRIEPEAFFDYLEGRTENPVYEVFDSRNALPSSLVQANARIGQDALGRLWVPLGEGVTVIDHGTVRRNLTPPKTRIYEVEIDYVNRVDLTFASDQVLEIEPGVRSFQIRYTGISYPAPESVLFKTRLKGYEDWITGDRREAVYTNLDPNTYEFEVMSRNLDGVWSESPSRLIIKVKPSFYQRWEFSLLILLIGVGIVGAIIRFRTYRLRAHSRLLQQRVEDRTHDLSKSVVALKKANENKKKYLRFTAHELKNSVAAIVSTSELLKVNLSESSSNDCRKAENMELVEMIQNTGGNLLNSIHSTLEKEEKESASPISLERWSLKEIIQSVIELNQASAREKRQKIVFTELDPSESWIDGVHCRMAIDNYISNAIKYAPKGSTIWVSLQRELQAGQPQFRFQVKDEGPGLSEADKEQVFSMFARLSAKPTGNEHSTGLGLSIVKEIIEMQGGEVGVESTHGKGATFFFTIPDLAESPNG